MLVGCLSGLGPETVSMDEPVAGPFAVWIGRPLDHALLAQRAAGGDEPLLPLTRGLRFLLDVDQPLPACRAAVILSFEQLQGVCVQRWFCVCDVAQPSTRPERGRPETPVLGPGHGERSWSRRTW